MYVSVNPGLQLTFKNFNVTFIAVCHELTTNKPPISHGDRRKMWPFKPHLKSLEF